MPNTTIWKYPLVIKDQQDLHLPRGSHVLSVAEQGGELVLYAHVDPGAGATKTVEVRICGTGNMAVFPDGARFLGTVNTEDRGVWHVFVVEEGD